MGVGKQHPRYPLTTISVVGNINLDIKTSRISGSSRIFDDGESSVEKIYETIGGGGANTALAASIMGAKVHFFGCVGNDTLGQRLVRHMKSRGVQVHAVCVPGGTGKSIAMNWDNGRRHFISSLPSSALLNASAVSVRELVQAGCRHIYRADIWFSEPMLFGGNAKLLEACHREGIETSIDINWDPKWNVARDGKEVERRIDAVKQVLPFISYVHGNEGEILFFCRAQTIDQAARELARRGVGTVIVHRGSRGSAAFANGGWIESSAFPVQKVVSDTGSGDVFTAAFLIHGGLALAERLRISALAAANHLQGTPCYIPIMED